MSKLWYYIFLTISIQYSLMSELYLLSQLSLTLLIMSIISFFWDDSSIFLVKSKKSILINLFASSSISILLIWSHLIQNLFYLIENLVIPVFSELWLNMIFSILLITCIIKMISNFTFKRKLLSLLILILIPLSAFSKEIDFLVKLSESKAISGTLYRDNSSLSYQVKGFPFFCAPLGVETPNTLITLKKDIKTLYVSLSLLTIQSIPQVCKKRILSAISSLSEKNILSNHNLELSLKEKVPFRLEYMIPLETIDEDLTKRLFSFNESSIGKFKAIAGIMFILAMIIYLHQFKFIRKKED